MKTPSAIRKAFLSALAAIMAIQGCQTTASKTNRDVASYSELSPRVVEILHADAYDGFGIVARSVLLGKRFDRANVGKGLAVPAELPFNHEVWMLEFGLASIVNLALATGSLVSVITNESFEPIERLLAARFRGGESSARVGTLGVSSSATASVATGFFVSLWPVAENRERGGAVGVLQFVFRARDVQTVAQREADAKNATVQAEFVAGLKSSSAALARRWGALYRLEESAVAAIDVKLQSKMMDEFKVRETWRAGDEVKVDIRKILRAVVPDADERYAALEFVTQNVGSGDQKPLRNLAEVRKFYAEEVKQLRALNAETLAKYRDLAVSSDPALKSMSNDYLAFSLDIEKYRRTIETHAKMFNEGASQ